MPRRRSGPGRRTARSLSLATVGLLLAVLAPPAWGQSTSPGPLARSHLKLEGADKCSKCHEAGRGVADQLCLDCHKNVQDSLFHRKQIDRSGKACASCHRDHKGRDFRMIRWRAPAGFDHGQTGHELQGAHRKPACAACHRLPGRWMGLKRACNACHADEHKPTLGGGCEKCHDEVKFKGASRFDHGRAKFRLEGAHQKVDCARCHPGTGAGAKFKGVAFKRCNACHRDPVPGHSARGQPGAAAEDCRACHTNRTWREVSRQAAVAMHDGTKMKLIGAHRPLACEKCHKSRLQPGADPVSRLGAFRGLTTACADCHQDPHSGRMGRDCQRCHDEKAWKGSKARGGFDHAKTRFPLQGAHGRVACASCHKGKGSYKREFAGLRFDRCSRCHQDPHGGPFGSVPAGDRCETCHDELGFAPAHYALDDHDRSAFALQRVHRVVPCSACHKPADPAVPAAAVVNTGRRGRRPAPVKAVRLPARLKNLGKDCRDCHKDPHGGQFTAGEQKKRCTDCHNQGDFKSIRFEHDKTRFKLLGEHKKAACAGCHFKPAPDQPVQFAGTSMRCEDCHRTPHGGQFDSAGPERGCADCHLKIAPRFAIEGFDHARTRFELRGRHAKAACAACHKKVGGPEGKSAVHWRLGELACEDCHANPHDRSTARRKQRGEGGR